MKNDLDQLYNNLIQLSLEVKLKFRKKGLSVPVQNKDGSIGLGSYKIIKNPGLPVLTRVECLSFD